MADPIKLFFLRFPIFALKLACLLQIYKMTLLSSKKQKNYVLMKKKSFIRLAIGVISLIRNEGNLEAISSTFYEQLLR